MLPFIVIVSRHKHKDFFTTQFDVFVEAENKSGARDLVRIKYPPIYAKFWDNGHYIGVVAHFTGEVYQAH